MTNINKYNISTVAPEMQQIVPISSRRCRTGGAGCDLSHADPATTAIHPVFLEPTLTRSTTRDMLGSLRCAVRRYRGGDGRGVGFYGEDARLWWLWIARRHPGWLTDGQLALLSRWTVEFRVTLVRNYVGNFEGSGRAREQSDLAYIHEWLRSVRINLNDEVNLRVGRFVRKPSTPEAEALKRIYWDRNLGGAGEAEQQWLIARLPACVSTPDFVGDRAGVTVLSQPTAEEWAEASRREDCLSAASDWSGHSFPYAAAPMGAGREAWL